MRTLVVFFALIWLTGCGTASRWKERHENKISSNTSITNNTTVVERIDTVVKVKKDSVVAVRPLKELLDGKPITATDGKNTVNVTYDDKSGSVRAVGITEAHEVPVSMEKITTSETQTDQAINSKETHSQEHKGRKSSGFPWGIIVTLAVFLVIAIYLLYRRARDGLRR